MDDLLVDLPSQDMAFEERAEEEHLGSDRFVQGKLYKKRVRTLPPALRRHVEKIQNPWFGMMVLDSIDAAATAEAIEAGESHRGGWVARPVRKRVLQAWGMDQQKIRWVQVLATRVLTAAHYPYLARTLEPISLPRVPVPSTGMWEAVGDLNARFPNGMESGADQVMMAIATLCWDSYVTSAQRRARVLQWGASTRNLGQAIDCLEARAGRCLTLHEVEAFDSEHDTYCVEGPRWRWDFSPTEHYDAIVMTPPCPSEGTAAQLRGVYLNAKTEFERQELDPGRFGPRRWMLVLGQALVNSVPNLRAGGTLVMYLPEGVRVSFEEATGEYRRGATYQHIPQILDWVRPSLRNLGLEVVMDIEVIEKNPRSQPWIGTRRPPYRLIVAKKPKVPHA